MLPISDCHNNNPGTIFGKQYLATANRLLTPDDLENISYTVYEQEDPEVNNGTPVPGFVDIPVDMTRAVFQELQKTDVYTLYGPRSVEYNTRVVVAPYDVVESGTATTVVPFPNRGMFYRVEIKFTLKDKSKAPFFQVEIIRSV